jgi:ankyrin repeat protein
MPESPIFTALAAGDHDAMAAIVATDPTQAMARDADGVSVLMAARYRFDEQAMMILRGADQPLDVFEASAFDEADRTATLLAAEPSQAFHLQADGFSALHLAAFFGALAAARSLVAAGARVNLVSRNDFRVMPLHSAIAGRHAGVARILIPAGADVNAAQREGYRPLHQAAEHGDAELIEMLLVAGADPSLTNDAGESPAEFARRHGHDEVAERLARA